MVYYVTIRNGVTNDNSGAINGVINGAINLSANEQAVFNEIVSDPNITREKLCTATSLGKGTVDRAIKSLKEKGVIERIGSKKTGHWRINRN